MHIEIQGLSGHYRLSADEETLNALRVHADRRGRIPKSAIARLYFPVGCTADGARRSWGRMVNTAHEPTGERLIDVLDDVCATWRRDHLLPEPAVIALLHFCGPAPDLEDLRPHARSHADRQP